MPYKDIPCPLQSGENAELLLDYASRKLTAVQRMAIDQHITGCPACQKFRDEQELLWKTLDTWESSSFKPGFDMRLEERIAADSRLPTWERAVLWAQNTPLKPAIPVAAAILLVALGLGLRWLWQ